jgi:hypothetical protein
MRVIVPASPAIAVTYEALSLSQSTDYLKQSLSTQAIIAQGAALACPRYDARYLPFEQAAALAAQQRASYCVRR